MWLLLCNFGKNWATFLLQQLVTLMPATNEWRWCTSYLNVSRIMVKSTNFPSSGTTSDVGGMISASSKKNTVNDSRIEMERLTWKIIVFIFKKKLDHAWPLFVYFWSFQANHTIFTTINVKKYPFQYPVLGFELMIFWLWVSSFNHLDQGSRPNELLFVIFLSSVP